MNAGQLARLQELNSMSERTSAEEFELRTLQLLGTRRDRKLSIHVTQPEQRADNTLSFVLVSDDNGGKRYDWESGEYYTEILDVNGSEVERLNTFFKDHYRSVDSAIGKVFNVRVEDGLLIGDVTFGTDEGSQTIYRKYLEGILTDVSIGYEILDYEVTRGADDKSDEVLITRYSLIELSAVGVGFDSGAKKRNKDTEDGDVKVNKKELQRLAELQAMSKRNDEQNVEMSKLLGMQKEANEAERAKLEADRVAMEADKAELKRAKDVNDLVITYGERGAKVLETFDGKKPTADEFSRALLDAFAGQTPHASTNTTDTNDRKRMIDGMVDGVALRVGANIAEPAEGADMYRNFTLVELAKELDPEATRGMSKADVAERSLVTGDFPLLLQSVGARVLTSEFERQTPTYKIWMAEVDVPDFRTMTDLTKSFGGGRLSKRKENGDLEKISGKEKSESWKIDTFGNEYTLTREMLINDDLGAFTEMGSTFAEMASNLTNGLAYDILQLKGDFASYKLADAKSIYHATRNNTATDALSATALSSAKVAMMKHKALDGSTPLYIKPKYLIVAPELEQTALEILGASSKVGADNVNVPNVHLNSLTVVVDPEIESATAWYLLAETKTFKMGFLQGTGRSPQLKMNDTSILRTTFQGIFDVGVTAVDYKGLYRGNV